MSRLRWPDSTNSVSDVPGTIQFTLLETVYNVFPCAFICDHL